MADDIVLINKQPKLDGRSWLTELFVHPMMRLKQKQSIESVPLVGAADVDLASTVHSEDAVSRVNPSSLLTRIRGAYRKVYVSSGSGYELRNNKILPSERQDKDLTQGGKWETYQGEHFGHSVATFLGAPNRIEKLNEDGKPVFNLWTIAKNYVAWTPLFRTVMKPDTKQAQVVQHDGSMAHPLVPKWELLAGERTFWAIVALPFKFAIYMPIQVVLTPVRFLINVAKLATEFASEFLNNETAYWAGKVFNGISTNWNRKLKSQAGHENDPNASANRFTKGVAIVAQALFLALPLIVLHTVARVWLLLGTAFTSPNILAKSAWEYAQRLELEMYPTTTKVLRVVFGALGFIFSVALTVALWSVALPFAIGSIVKLVPQFMTVVNAVLNSSFIAPAMAYVNGALQVVGGWLAVFSPLVSAIAANIGFQVTTAMLAVGVSLAGTAALAGTVFGLIGTALANWTVMRPLKAGPFTALHNWATRNKAKGGEAPLPPVPPQNSADAQAQAQVEARKPFFAAIVALVKPIIGSGWQIPATPEHIDLAKGMTELKAGKQGLNMLFPENQGGQFAPADQDLKAEIDAAENAKIPPSKLVRDLVAMVEGEVDNAKKIAMKNYAAEFGNAMADRFDAAEYREEADNIRTAVAEIRF